jgi:hypothetical protein
MFPIVDAMCDKVCVCVCHCASGAKTVPTAHANMFSIVDAVCDNVCVCHCASNAEKLPTAHANMFSIVDAMCDNVCVSLRFKCEESANANCTCEHVFDR